MTDDPGLVPDTQVSVREVFGLDSALRVPAFRTADAHVPEIDPAVLQGCLERYPYVYQHAADDAVPIWQLRHPELARG